MLQEIHAQFVDTVRQGGAAMAEGAAGDVGADVVGRKSVEPLADGSTDSVARDVIRPNIRGLHPSMGRFLPMFWGRHAGARGECAPASRRAGSLGGSSARQQRTPLAV